VDPALRPEAEEGCGRRRAADPELDLEIVVPGEDEELADHVSHVVEEAIAAGGGERVLPRVCGEGRPQSGEDGGGRSEG
jgi:hypothetical protein